jgi:hypothetical protein
MKASALWRNGMNTLIELALKQANVAFKDWSKHEKARPTLL